MSTTKYIKKTTSTTTTTTKKYKRKYKKHKYKEYKYKEAKQLTTTKVVVVVKVRVVVEVIVIVEVKVVVATTYQPLLIPIPTSTSTPTTTTILATLLLEQLATFSKGQLIVLVKAAPIPLLTTPPTSKKQKGEKQPILYYTYLNTQVAFSKAYRYFKVVEDKYREYYFYYN